MDPNKWKLYESALIKSIRRGLADDAIYWGCLLYKLGRADLVWRRIFIHLSEDIGVADRTLPANIAALYNNYELLSRSGTTSFEGVDSKRLPFVHAIMLMATAQKSRSVDSAVVVHFGEQEEREVPDYCIDFHSPLGRRMGRNAEHFLNVAAHIENESPIKNQWQEKACLIMRASER